MQVTPATLSRWPLHVLCVCASPEELDAVDCQAMAETVRTGLGAKGEVTYRSDITPGELQNALREQAFHILHYHGHGTFAERADAGYLLLHGADGGTYSLSAKMLATYLDGVPLRLVLLTSCETAADSREKRFAGIAQQLMRTTRLPAVVAMQYEISQASALAFSRQFYDALADGYPVDAAVVSGRQGILSHLGRDAFARSDWATPVLYLRLEDGEIFRTERDEDEQVSGQEEVAGADQITARNISGTGIAIGRGARTEVDYGDTYSGDFRGAILNVRSTLTNVSQSVDALPGADDATRAELERLMAQLDAALERAITASPEKANDAAAVADLTKDLVETASAERPNKTLIQVTSEGLKQAARNIAEVTPAVLDIATKIVSVVVALAG